MAAEGELRSPDDRPSQPGARPEPPRSPMTTSNGAPPTGPAVLHDLIRQRRFADAILRISDVANRTEARAVDPTTGNVPLLAALRIKCTPLALVDALLDAYPYEEVTRDILRGASQHARPPSSSNSNQRSTDGGAHGRQSPGVNDANVSRAEGSPLFVAVKHRLSVDVIRRLVSVSGIDRLRDDINREKQLPLHVAPVDHPETVGALINLDSRAATPSKGAGAASSADLHGLLPIHHFVQRGQPTLASVELLLSAFPDSLRRRDNSGKLPLHYAMTHNASVVLIECFVASYPDSVRIPDRDGNYPIHCAFLEGSRTFNLRRKLPILLRAYPESANLRNGDGLTPLGVAERCRRRNRVNSLDYNIEGPVRELLGRRPEEWYAHRVLRRRRVRSLPGPDEAQQGGPPNGKRLRLSSSSAADAATVVGGSGDIRTVPPPRHRASLHQQCASCREDYSNHALVPCGHVALCGQCAEADQLFELGGCCPINKCRFFRAQKVFGKAVASPATIGATAEVPLPSTEPEEDRCVICLEGARSHLLVPCGHVLLCKGCANDDVLKQLEMTCPLARCRVRGVMKVEWQKKNP